MFILKFKSDGVRVLALMIKAAAQGVPNPTQQSASLSQLFTVVIVVYIIMITLYDES